MFVIFTSATLSEEDKTKKNQRLVHILRPSLDLFNNLKVHDELVLEADPSVINDAGLLPQMSMEGAASLLVPLLVKLKLGRTWGSMEPFLVEQHASDVTISNSNS